MRITRGVLAVAGILALASAQAQTFNVQSGFGTANNPLNQFSYGTKTSFTLSTFTLLTSQINSGGFVGWGSTTALAGAAVVKNTSGAAASIGTASFAQNSIVMLPTGSLNSVLRFTAPSAGAYTLSGSFAYMPTATGGDGVNVDIHTFSGASTAALVDNVLLTSAGTTTQSFNVTTANLASGAFIDFSVSRGPANKTGDAVRLQGTITAVPEPATICFLAAGSLGLLRRRRKK